MKCKSYMVGKQNKSICMYRMTHCSELYQNRSQHPGSVQRMQASPSQSSLLCGGHAGWCTRLSSLEQTLSSRDHYRSLCLKTARCFTITLGTVHFIRVVSTKHTTVASERCPVSWMPVLCRSIRIHFVCFLRGVIIAKKYKDIFCTTLRSLSSLPAKASNKVVLPDPGGPNRSVNLHKRKEREVDWSKKPRNRILVVPDY